MKPETFSSLPIKDKISYVTAITLIASGIIMAFLSFFFNERDIATGVLLYIAQTFVVGGSLIGINVYFKSKWIEIDTRTKEEIQKEIEKLFINKED